MPIPWETHACCGSTAGTVATPLPADVELTVPEPCQEYGEWLQIAPTVGGVAHRVAQ